MDSDTKFQGHLCVSVCICGFHISIKKMGRDGSLASCLSPLASSIKIQTMDSFGSVFCKIKIYNYKHQYNYNKNNDIGPDPEIVQDVSEQITLGFCVLSIGLYGFL